MDSSSFPIIDCYDLPEHPQPRAAYRLLAKDARPGFYDERTDRNIGWITKGEQDILRKSVVGIAGCGGMGGLLAMALVRAGVGEVRIADCEMFDVSNINRQFGAGRSTIGRSKALTTARMVRDAIDDSVLIVYPEGITEETVHSFLDGCDVACDEIEVLAIDARILFHQHARQLKVPLFNCNTAGFGTNLFLYTHESMTMEEATGLTYQEACRLRAQAGQGHQDALDRIVTAMMRAVVPNLPEYSPDEPEANREAFHARFKNERKVPIIATNPVFAAGFLADRVLLHLLKDSGVERDITPTPVMPGYLMMDAAAMTATCVRYGWNPSEGTLPPARIGVAADPEERTEAIEYIEHAMRARFECDPPPTHGCILVARLGRKLVGSIALQGTERGDPFAIEKHYDFDADAAPYPFDRSRIVEGTRWAAQYPGVSKDLVLESMRLAVALGKRFMLIEAKPHAIDRLGELGFMFLPIPGALLRVDRIRPMVGDRGMRYFLDQPAPSLYLCDMEGALRQT